MAYSSKAKKGFWQSVLASLKTFSVGQRRVFWSYLAIALGMFVLIFGLYAAFQPLRAPLLREDQGVENITVVFLVAAFLVACVAIAKRGLANLPRGYAVIGLVGLVAALEELSYGQRFFPNLKFPELSNGATFDALHDTNRVVSLAFDRAGIPWEITLPLVAIVLFFLFRKPLLTFLKHNLRLDRVWLYMLIALACVFVSVYVDTFVNPPLRFVLLEEIAEMSAAISVLFAALSGFVIKRSARQAR